MKDILELVKIAQNALEDKLGKDVKVLDLRGISDIADYFLIATGNNASQVRAMADNVEEKLFKAGLKLNHSEGYTAAAWVLLDFGNILVHIFDKEQRDFYNLDRVWADAKEVE